MRGILWSLLLLLSRGSKAELDTQGRVLVRREHPVQQSLLNADDAHDAYYADLANEVKDAFRHAWHGYTTYALGADDLRPISGGWKSWINDQNTLIDALSTLWIMGLTEEFHLAKERVAKINYADMSDSASVFETTIRDLGGLCSAHSLSGERIFLQKATELADYLLPCLGVHGCAHPALSGLAERGTLQLEFRYVSQQTGNPRYQVAADALFGELLSEGINVQTVGGGADSYYEYMLKLYLQSGQREPALKEAWLKSMTSMQSNLVKTTALGNKFVAMAPNSFDMDHLSCFIGGNLALGAHNLKTLSKEDTHQLDELGLNLTRTCYKFTRITKTGQAPDKVSFDMDSKIQDMIVAKAANDRKGLLRPEVIESIYYQSYFATSTDDQDKYRRWATHIFQAINATSRTKFGFAELVDVDEWPPRQTDRMQSWFLAETLCYIYLTLAPRSTMDLSQFVFNTEAHPLRINPTADAFFQEGVEKQFDKKRAVPLRAYNDEDEPVATDKDEWGENNRAKRLGAHDDEDESVTTDS